MLKNFLKDESGAAAVEYGLLVGLIAMVILAAVSALGNNLSTFFSTVANMIASWSTG